MKHTEQQLHEAMRKTISNIEEILQKSGFPMKKDEGAEGAPDQLEGQAEGEMSAEGAAPAEGAAEGAAPAGGAEGAAEGEMGGEGEDETQAMMEHLQGLDSEALHMMLELIQNELSAREAQEGEGAEGQAEGAAPAAGAGDQLEMSMKQEFASLAKSMSEMAKTVQTLAQAQASMQNEMQTLRKSEQKRPAAAKPAAQNRNVQVLQKSEEPKVEKLTKSGIEGFLMNELRKSSSTRNPAVSADLLAELTYIKTPAEVSAFADRLREKGIQLPS